MNVLWDTLIVFGLVCCIWVIVYNFAGISDVVHILRVNGMTYATQRNLEKLYIWREDYPEIRLCRKGLLTSQWEVCELKEGLTFGYLNPTGQYFYAKTKREAAKRLTEYLFDRYMGYDPLLEKYAPKKSSSERMLDDLEKAMDELDKRVK